MLTALIVFTRLRQTRCWAGECAAAHCCLCSPVQPGLFLWRSITNTGAHSAPGVCRDHIHGGNLWSVLLNGLQTSLYLNRSCLHVRPAMADDAPGHLLHFARL